jgi:hypothetical protein
MTCFNFVSLLILCIGTPVKAQFVLAWHAEFLISMKNWRFFFIRLQLSPCLDVSLKVFSSVNLGLDLALPIPQFFRLPAVNSRHCECHLTCSLSFLKVSLLQDLQLDFTPPSRGTFCSISCNQYQPETL